MKMKSILSVILKFFLSFFLFCLISLIILKLTVLNKEYMLEVLKENDYYEKVSLSTRDEMKKYLIQSGFAYEILDNIYTDEDVEADINQLIDQIYSNEKIILDTTRIENNLRSAITSYFEVRNIRITSSKEIDNFIAMMGDIYKEEVGIIKYLGILQNVVINITKYVIPVGAVLAVLSIITLIGLFLLKSKGMIITPFLTLTIVYIFVVFYLKRVIDIDHLLILSQDISDIIRYVFLDVTGIFLKIAIVSFIIAIVLIIWRKYAKKGN